MATNTAASFTNHTGNASAGPFSISFSYLDEDEVDVTVDGVLKTKTTHYTFPSATTISFTSGNHPANGVAIKFQRNTDISALKVDFEDGSVLTETDLDNNSNQILYGLQEHLDTTLNDLVYRDGSKTITGNLVFEGATDNAHETTLAITDPTSDKTITLPDTTGTVVTTGDTGTVTSTMLADGTIATADLADNSVTMAKLNSGTLPSDIVVNENNLSANSVGSSELADDAVDTAAIADNAVTMAKLNSGALPTDVTVASANIVDGTIVSGDIATGTLDGRYYTETELDAGQLDNRYYTETEADARFYNLASTEEIQSGETWVAADNKVATTSAIDNRIVDLVDDVGGFVPIANETSFPNANPDVNNGAGTLVSIKALSSNITSDGSGVATIANGTVGNSTVTINGLANSTTYASTFGMIVETTTTLNTYTFHRLVPKATEVTTVSGSISNVNTVAGAISNVNTVASNASNINTTAGSIANVNLVGGSISNVNSVASNLSTVNDFAARYRTGANNPTDSLDTGDLFFNTSANELKVYNGSEWQGGVTASGNFASVTGNTFTGDNLYNDGVKAKFGTDSDFQAYHDNTNAYLMNQTGTLRVRGNDIRLQDVNGENYIKNTQNGSVELYYDNSIKLSTINGGISVTGGVNTTGASSFNGDIFFGDNKKTVFGAGNDLQIYHDGSNSYLTNSTATLLIRGDNIDLRPNTNSGEVYLRCTQNGAVELRYDSVNKLETTSYGASANGSVRIQNWSGSHGLWVTRTDADPGASVGVQIACDSTKSFIKSYGANLRFQIAAVDGTASNALIIDQATKDADFYGDINVLDNKKLLVGTGDDLQIYHDGTHSRIKNDTGGLYIHVDNGEFLNRAGDEVIAKFLQNSSCELYYDNSKKLATTSTGVEIPYDGYGRVEIIPTEGNGGTAVIKQTTTSPRNGGDLAIQVDAAIQGGNLLLRTGGSTDRLKITSDGHVQIPGDSKHLYIGAGQELSMMHNGTHSYVEDIVSGGNLILRTKSGGLMSAIVLQAGQENSVICKKDGAVELYCDGSKKLETTSSGVTVTGALKSDNICKAWCNWNGTGTPAIRDSYNVASLTDLGIAVVTVNIDTDLSNANYAVVSHARADSDGGGRLVSGAGTPAAGTYKFQTVNTGNDNEECEENCVAFFGDGG